MLKWNPEKLNPLNTRGANTTIKNFRDEHKLFTSIFIREFMQNFLDARINNNSGEISRISIRILEEDKIDKSYNKNALENLLPHLKASNSELGLETPTPDFNNPTALVLEEFLTVGLTGNINDSGAKGREERWANFWFGEAKPSKTGKDLGRAGQGKVTYNMASSTNTIFALSIPDENSKGLLFGKCIFAHTHKIMSDEFGHNSYWSNLGKEDHEQPVPTTDPVAINDFKKAYSLERKDGLRGTSWVIPFPKSHIDKESLIKAFLQEFFIPIYRNKAEIKICGEEITRSNLNEYVRKYLGEGEPSIEYFDFLEHTMSADSNGLHAVKSQWWQNPVLTEDCFEPEELQKINNDFEKEECVGFILPVSVYPKKGNAKESYIKVWVQLREKHRCEYYYVRDDLIITHEQHLPKMAPVFGLVLAEDGAISEFLAGAEEASHLKWNQKEDGMESYNRSNETLSNVRQSIVKLFNLLRGSNKERIEDLFDDILSIPGTGAKKKQKRKSRKKDKVVTPPKPEDIPASHNFLIIDDGSGVELKPGPGAKDDKVEFPVTGSLKVAYNNISGYGDPFKNYHPAFDFDFKNSSEHIKIAKNINILQKMENKIDFEIIDKDFYLQVRGFKADQQVRVKAGVDLS